MYNLADKLWHYLSQTRAYSSMSFLERLEFIIHCGLAHIVPSVPLYENTVAYALLGHQRKTQKRISETLLAEMARLTQQFKKANVHVVFFKGPLLGELLYGDIHHRPTSDIDLFAEYDHVAPMMELLQKAGYMAVSGGEYSKDDYLYDFHKGDLRTKLTCRHSACVRRQGDACYTVELHANPFRNYEKCTNEDLRKTSIQIYANMRWQEYAEKTFPVPGYIDLFLMLCSHFARHTLEELSRFCSSEDMVYPIRLQHLHDLALYYIQFQDKLTSPQLLEMAKQYTCTADLAFAIKYLSEIYGIALYDEIGVACLSFAQKDIENNIYIDIVENLCAEELFLGNRITALSKLKEQNTPVKTYRCQPFDETILPEADCEVCENFDRSYPAMATRPPFSFFWGASLSATTLSLCVSIPVNEVAFFPASGGVERANTSIWIYLCADCNKKGDMHCCNIHEMSIFKKNRTLHATVHHRADEPPSDIPISLRDGRYIVYPRIELPLFGRKTIRFMISREISLRSPGTGNPCNFALRWVDSVAVSHKTCLSFGELQANL